MYPPSAVNHERINRSHFKGHNRDDYVPPSAHYEMAVVAWAESDRPPPPPSGDDAPAATTNPKAYRKEKLDECQSWLEKVFKWETFVLDARLGIRVQTGLETLKWIREHHGLK